jgi:hypothetical protein
MYNTVGAGGLSHYWITVHWTVVRHISGLHIGGGGASGTNDGLIFFMVRFLSSRSPFRPWPNALFGFTNHKQKIIQRHVNITLNRVDMQLVQISPIRLSRILRNVSILHVHFVCLYDFLAASLCCHMTVWLHSCMTARCYDWKSKSVYGSCKSSAWEYCISAWHETSLYVRLHFCMPQWTYNWISEELTWILQAWQACT